MRRLLALMFTAVLALGALAACGGDDDDANNSGAPGQQQDGGDDGGSGDGSTDDGDTGDGSLSDLLAKQKDATIKITYRQQDGELLTISQDGDRVATFIGEDSSYISTPDGAVSCSGLDTDAPTCTEMPDVGGNLGALGLASFQVYASIAESVADVAGVDTASDTVAGRDATCVTVNPKEVLDATIAGQLGIDGDVPDKDATICVDDETGYLLLLDGWDGEDTPVLEATEVGEPSDSDFEPPVTPETIPGL
jgi:hypothetical protein